MYIAFISSTRTYIRARFQFSLVMKYFTYRACVRVYSLFKTAARSFQRENSRVFAAIFLNFLPAILIVYEKTNKLFDMSPNVTLIMSIFFKSLRYIYLLHIYTYRARCIILSVRYQYAMEIFSGSARLFLALKFSQCFSIIFL